MTIQLNGFTKLNKDNYFNKFWSKSKNDVDAKSNLDDYKKGNAKIITVYWVNSVTKETDAILVANKTREMRYVKSKLSKN